MTNFKYASYFAAIIAAHLSKVLALEVTPGSQCGSFCLTAQDGDGFNSRLSRTNTSEIACFNSDFYETEIGKRFKSCVECLQTSDRVRAAQSDLHWYLYNLRYALSTCVFFSPEPPLDSSFTSSCTSNDTCLPLKGAITSSDMGVSTNETYDYCEADKRVFSGDVLLNCIDCLRSKGDSSYLANFMLALDAGCEQQPERGDHLGINGSLFSSQAINVTDHPVSHRGPEQSEPDHLATPVVAGIVVGTLVIFIIALALFVVHFRSERQFEEKEQRRMFLKYFGRTGSFFFRPSLNKLSPNQSSYSHKKTTGSNEQSPTDTLSYNLDPRSMNTSSASALPTHQAYLPHKVSRPYSNHITRALDGFRITPIDKETGLPKGGPSPPPSRRASSRPPTPDSYIFRTYLEAGAHPRQSLVPQPPPAAWSRDRNAVPASLTTPGASPESGGSTWSRVFLPIRQLFSRSGDRPEMQISSPILTYDPRFHNVPEQNDVVEAAHQQAFMEFNRRRIMQYDEVSVRSGKSTLYGY